MEREILVDSSSYNPWLVVHSGGECTLSAPPLCSGQLFRSNKSTACLPCLPHPLPRPCTLQFHFIDGRQVGRRGGATREMNRGLIRHTIHGRQPQQIIIASNFVKNKKKWIWIIFLFKWVLIHVCFILLYFNWVKKDEYKT